jgi:hypothetical protein
MQATTKRRVRDLTWVTVVAGAVAVVVAALVAPAASRLQPLAAPPAPVATGVPSIDRPGEVAVEVRQAPARGPHGVLDLASPIDAGTASATVATSTTSSTRSTSARSSARSSALVASTRSGRTTAARASAPTASPSSGGVAADVPAADTAPAPAAIATPDSVAVVTAPTGVSSTSLATTATRGRSDKPVRAPVPAVAVAQIIAEPHPSERIGHVAEEPAATTKDADHPGRGPKAHVDDEKQRGARARS